MGAVIGAWRSAPWQIRLAVLAIGVVVVWAIYSACSQLAGFRPAGVGGTIPPATAQPAANAVPLTLTVAPDNTASALVSPVGTTVPVEPSSTGAAGASTPSAPSATPIQSLVPAKTLTATKTAAPPSATPRPATATAKPSTATPVLPTNTPVPPAPAPPSGVNVTCNQFGAVQICAWVDKGSPSGNASVTVFGRLLVNETPQSGLTMDSVWSERTSTSTCTGVTGANGVASCAQRINRASAGYRVNINVSIGGYQATTWFTPQ